MHELLSVERYLDKIFWADQHLRQASSEVELVERGETLPNSFTTPDAAKSWLSRLQIWKSNLQRDLELDSLPAP
eukprot:8372279-Karenia_brevis.AAC.1